MIISRCLSSWMRPLIGLVMLAGLVACDGAPTTGRATPLVVGAPMTPRLARTIQQLQAPYFELQEVRVVPGYRTANGGCGFHGADSGVDAARKGEVTRAIVYDATACTWAVAKGPRIEGAKLPLLNTRLRDGRETAHISVVRATAVVGDGTRNDSNPGH